MSEHVYLLQRAVQRGGYYCGPLDGGWSDALDKAVERMRRARGEPLNPHKPFNGLETQSEASGA